MPRDISGNYTLPTGNPVVDGTIIEADWANDTMNDIAAQLNNVVTRDGLLGPTAPVLGPNGSAAAPTYSFTSDPDLGIYRVGANQLGVSAGNALMATFAAAAFTLAPNVSMALSGTGGIAVDGTGVFSAPLGAVGAPSYSFNGDLNTGIYSPGADQVAMSVGGGQSQRWTGSLVNITVSGAEVARWTAAQQSNVLGAVGAPSYSFTGDLDTGVYSPATNQVAVSLGGAQRMLLSGVTAVFGGGAAGLAGGANLTIGNVVTPIYSALSTSGPEFLAGASGTATFAGSFSAHDFAVRTNNTARVNILAAGNATVNAPDSGTTTLTVMQVAGAGDAILTQQSHSGTLEWALINAANTASAQSRFFQSVGGSSAADVFGRMDVSGVTNWSYGIDNSDGDSFKINSGATPGSGSGVVITTDGRLYGTALHNSAGSVTGTTNQYIASGTYTPTLTNVTNIDASTAFVTQWIRVGNVVMVSGRVDVDPTVASGWVLGVSLPIASNFASVQQCTGTGCADRSAGGGNPEISIEADSVNDRANFEGGGSSTVNGVNYFQFMYLIV